MLPQVAKKSISAGLNSLYSNPWQQRNIRIWTVIGWLTDTVILFTKIIGVTNSFPLNRQPTKTSLHLCHFQAVETKYTTVSTKLKTCQLKPNIQKWLSITHKDDFDMKEGWKWNFIRSIMSGTINNDLLTCIDMLTTRRMACLSIVLLQINTLV